ncbi:hypothetical protein F4809DRAFT_653393 [Biscogniauxia mediterranea]|nr:hypothetical protein F4809DRAFT_653393 [Biscogniauxia mediterranea]
MNIGAVAGLSLPIFLASLTTLLAPILPILTLLTLALLFPLDQRQEHRTPSPTSSFVAPSFGSIFRYIEKQQPQPQPQPSPVPGACERRQDQRQEPHTPSCTSSFVAPSFGSIFRYIERQQQQPPQQPPPSSRPGACERRQDQRRELRTPSPTSSFVAPSFGSIFRYIERQQQQQQQQQQPSEKHASEKPVPLLSSSSCHQPHQPPLPSNRQPPPPTPPPLSPSTGCGSPCAKVKKFLPAHFCGHEVPPHKMKDGNRVVRIDHARAMRNVALCRAEARAKAAEKAAQAAPKPSPPMPSTVCPSTPQQEPFSLATPRSLPWSRPSPPGTPTPAPRRFLPPSVTRSSSTSVGKADYDIRGFRNPDLNDIPPMDFTPSMFKPDIDRNNDFTWSSWDSRSTELSWHEWVSPTEPRGALENLACKHPDLALRIQRAMAGLPLPDPKESLDFSATYTYSSISSSSSSSFDSSAQGAESFGSALSTDWVWVDEEPWIDSHAIGINTMLARDWAGVVDGAEYRKYIRELVQFGHADPPAESASPEIRAIHEAKRQLADSPSALSAQSTLSPSPTTSTPSNRPASVSATHHFGSLRHVPIATTTTTAPPPPPPAPAKKSSSLGWKSLSCIAVAATTVAAGLAYAWFSG